MSNLKLTFDKRNHKAWRPGDIVSGTIQLAASLETVVERLTLLWEGRIFTEWEHDNEKREWTKSSQVTLFRNFRTLLKGPHTVEKDMAWDFKYAFPKDCRGAQCDLFRVGNGVRHRLDFDQTQTLPPHCSWKTGSHTGRVQYRLLVKLDKKGWLAHNEQIESSLRLEPYRSDGEPGSMPSSQEHLVEASIRSSQLDISSWQQEGKWSDRVVGFFSPSSLPSASFTVRFEAPTYDIGSVKEPKFTVSLAHTSEITGTETPVPDFPPVVLKQLVIFLRTHKLAIGQMGPQNGGDKEFYDNDRERLAEWQGSVQLSAKRQLDLVQDLGVKIKMLEMPWLDISTFTIARWTCFEIVLTVECAGQRLEVRLKDGLHRCRIIPWSTSGSDNENMEAAGVSTSTRMVDASTSMRDDYPPRGGVRTRLNRR